MYRRIVGPSRSAGPFLAVAIVVATAGAAIAQGQPQRAAPTGREFEFAARQHYFAGVFRNDREAFNRGKEIIRQRLAEQPSDYEGLLWHGSYTATEGVWAFKAGDQAQGWKLWEEGVAAMARAVDLEPLDFGVRVGRGSRLISAGLNEVRIFPTDDPNFARRTLETGLADMELAYAIGQPMWGVLGPHERGQLLLLLAQGNRAIGKTDRARRFASECVERAQGSRYEGEARQFLAMLDQNNAGVAGNALAAEQPGGDRGGPPVAAQSGEPLEALFSHILGDKAAAALFEPAGLSDRLRTMLTSLEEPGADVDAALNSFEKFAQQQGASAWSWYGFAAVLRSGKHFEAGRWELGVPFWEKGLAALERGVKDSNGALGARLARGFVYAIVAKHEPDRAASGRMRSTGSADLAAIAEAMVNDGPSDARAAVIAAMGVLAREAGKMEDANRSRGEALGVAKSDAMRALISAILGPAGT